LFHPWLFLLLFKLPNLQVVTKGSLKPSHAQSKNLSMQQTSKIEQTNTSKQTSTCKKRENRKQQNMSVFKVPPSSVNLELATLADIP